MFKHLIMKCARHLCQNVSQLKWCSFHRCPICLSQKSSNDEYCQLCKGKLDKMKAPKESVAPETAIAKEAGRSPMDMMKELIGMEDVKQEVYNICRDIVCAKKQKEKGINLGEFETGHFVIMGNPGTGKTTIAQMMGKILHTYGVIKRPSVHVFQRESLVAAYVGQTAIKTKTAISATQGGICFIDEAYRLSSSDSRNDFGVEAIEEIMRFMTEEGFLFIFAGYPDEMKRFVDANPGIQRRVAHHVTIRDYNHGEIADILIQLIVKSRLNADFVRDDLVELLKESIDKRTMSKYNAAMAGRLFKLARTVMNESFSLTRQMSPPTTLTIEHLRVAALRV